MGWLFASLNAFQQGEAEIAFQAYFARFTARLSALLAVKSVVICAAMHENGADLWLLGY